MNEELLINVLLNCCKDILSGTCKVSDDFMRYFPEDILSAIKNHSVLNEIYSELESAFMHDTMPINIPLQENSNSSGIQFHNECINTIYAIMKVLELNSTYELKYKVFKLLVPYFGDSNDKIDKKILEIIYPNNT